MSKLRQGIVPNIEKTLGEMTFAGHQGDVYFQDEEGNPTDELKKRTYRIISDVQEGLIQISLPPEVPLREYDYEMPVELVNIEIYPMANRNGRNVEGAWNINASDIVPKKQIQKPQPNPQGPQNQSNKK